MEEIRSALWEIKDTTSPGPDGFNSKFFKIHWDVSKNLICKALNDVFQKGLIIKEWNHTFLHLIPKKVHSTSIQDFRPIACCNTLYKVFTKILCNRLVPFVDKLVSQNQMALIKGRTIGDGLLLAHEISRGLGRKNNKYMCIKVDLKKAYDSINRSFVTHMLNSMGFPRKWVRVIENIISTPVFSIISNRESHGYFESSNGLRQGDPLSPILFTLVMEYFTLLMDEKVREGLISPILEFNNKLTHLIYADDIIVFTKATTQTATAIWEVFNNMKRITGLELSCEKSNVFFGKGVELCNNISIILNVQQLELPVRYLGIPLSSTNLRDKDCVSLIEKIKLKVGGWENRMLSLSGRLELIKYTIYPIIQFWMQCFRLPVSTVQKIKHLILNFLWKSRNSKIPWEILCREKEEGGMGLRNLEELNRALYVKLIWKIINEEGIWAKYMKRKYIGNKSFWEISERLDDSGVWKFILKNRQEARKCLSLNIIDGKTTSLWYDPWLNGSSIMERIGRDAAIRTGTENLFLCKIIKNGVWKWGEFSFLYQIHAEIEGVAIHKDRERDYWSWKCTRDGLYQFKKVWNSIRTSFETKN